MVALERGGEGSDDELMRLWFDEGGGGGEPRPRPQAGVLQGGRDTRVAPRGEGGRRGVHGVLGHVGPTGGDGGDTVVLNITLVRF